MGAAVWGLWRFVFTDRFLHLGRAKLILAVAVCILAGVIVYTVLAVAVKAVAKEDIPARLRKKIWR